MNPLADAGAEFLLILGITLGFLLLMLAWLMLRRRLIRNRQSTLNPEQCPICFGMGGTVCGTCPTCEGTGRKKGPTV